MTTDTTQNKTMLALVALAAVTLIGSGAAAFETLGGTAGPPVRWNQLEVEVVLDESLADLGDLDVVESHIVSAFEEWVIAADLPVDFTFVRGICNEIGYLEGGPNESCVAARDDFSGAEDGHTGATTSLAYSAQTGDIVDADIVFNLDAGDWSVDGEPGAIDLDAVALHEVGHFLGLAHSEVEQARMCPTMATGAAAGLHGDDIDGAATLYAGVEKLLSPMSCSLVAGGATGPHGARAGLGATLALLAAAALFLARRRRG